MKTVGRKLIGIDRKYASELKKQLNLPSLPELRVFQMDAHELKFEDESFGFVYSRSVLHHLPDPGGAVDEIVRVLKPGGVAYISIHLYSSPSGCLDHRVFTNRGNEVGFWPHLRPQLRHRIGEASVYLNKLRPAEWRTVFERKMPGVDCILNRGDDPTLEPAARALQDQGELLEYSLDELLTFEVVALWRKPAAISH